MNKKRCSTEIKKCIFAKRTSGENVGKRFVPERVIKIP